jgi:hypothetical protein
MKSSFFSKQPRNPSDVDTLRDTTKLLSLRMGRLEKDFDTFKEQQQEQQVASPVASPSVLLIRQLEDDFFASQTRLQAFHESIASAMSEMNKQLQELEFRFSVFEKRQLLLEKQLDMKSISSFRTAKQVFENHTTKDKLNNTS